MDILSMKYLHQDITIKVSSSQPYDNRVIWFFAITFQIKSKAVFFNLISTHKICFKATTKSLNEVPLGW